MDAQPLMIVKPEDLSDFLVWFTVWSMVAAAAFGFAGYMVAEGVKAVWRAVRLRGASMPFAERAARLEARRLRCFLLLDRIAARNAREQARVRAGAALNDCPF